MAHPLHPSAGADTAALLSGNSEAAAAVFPFRLRERLLFAGPVEIDDPIVLQSGASYLSERFFLRLVAAGLIFF